MHLRADHQTTGSTQQMTFTTADLLAAVVATHAANTGRLARLASTDPGAGLRGAASPTPHTFTHHGGAAVPGAVETPFPPLLLDRLPRRQVVRQQAPGAAVPNQGEHRVHNRPSMLSHRSTSLRRRWQTGHKDRPFGVRQIGWIGHVLHASSVHRLRRRALSDGF